MNALFSCVASNCELEGKEQSEVSEESNSAI